MKPFSFLAAATLFCSAAYAQPKPPKTTPKPPVPTGLAGVIQNAERTQNADSLLLAYGQSVTDPTLARIALGQLLSGYYQMRAGAQTADQATQAVAEADLRFNVMQAAQNQVLVQQNQVIIQQNERIIALLEQMAKPDSQPKKIR